MMSKLFAGMLAFCVASTASAVTEARAGYMSGIDLLESCKPGVIDAVYRLKVAECRGYVIGVADTFDCGREVLGYRWNSRISLSQEELVNAVMRWLNAHPRQLYHQAGGLIAEALSASFPCGSQ